MYSYRLLSSGFRGRGGGSRVLGLRGLGAGDVDECCPVITNPGLVSGLQTRIRICTL